MFVPFCAFVVEISFEFGDHILERVIFVLFDVQCLAVSDILVVGVASPSFVKGDRKIFVFDDDFLFFE